MANVPIDVETAKALRRGGWSWKDVATILSAGRSMPFKPNSVAGAVCRADATARAAKRL